MSILSKLKLTGSERREMYVRGLTALLAAAIIAVVTWLVAKKTDFLPVASRFLQQPVSIPFWLVACALALFFYMAFAIVRRFVGPVHERLYRSDTLVGMVWRWGYHKYKLQDLKAFCVKCDTELMLNVNIAVAPDMTPLANAFHGTVAYCTSCNDTIAINNAVDLPDRIRRIIEKKIRDGSWRVKKSENGKQPPDGEVVQPIE